MVSYDDYLRYERGVIRDRYRATHDGNEPHETDYRHVEYRVLREGAQYPTFAAAIADWGEPRLPNPAPPPVFLEPPIIGRWRGNFLYPANQFFGPACAAFSPERRAAYFVNQRARGATHVLINAEQDDWGPSKGRPEWTAGGFSVYTDNFKNLPAFSSILLDARRAGLSPCVGIVDQPSLRAHSLDGLIGRTRRLVEATWPHVALYMLSWEIDEVWGNGAVREPNLERWIGEIDWHGRDVGIHFSAGNLSGGLNFYGRMPSNVVRLYQYEAAADEAVLRTHSRLIAEVAKRTNTKVCAFEHSSPVNQTPTHTETQAAWRAAICLDMFTRQGLSATQYGSLNS